MNLERVRGEIERLRADGILAELLDQPRILVLYREVPTDGRRFGLTEMTDVAVPVPDGYPQAMIDLAALPVESGFLLRVKGGANSQGEFVAVGRSWRLASYHPHSNGGGPPWNPLRHGFHTYRDQLIAWLHSLA